MDDLTTPLRHVLADIVGPERAAGVTATTDLVDDLLLDSVQLIALLLAVEDHLDIEIDFDRLELDHLRSLTRLAALIGDSDPCGA